MALIFLIIVLILVIASFLTEKIPLWLPLVIYLSIVLVKVITKIGDYNDWIKKNERDEKIEIENVDKDMAQRGLTFSGERIKKKKIVMEDFKFERSKMKRKLWVDLFDSLLFK